MILESRLYVLCALAALAALAPLGRTAPHPPPLGHTLDPDSAAIAQILDEMRGYYRDLHDRNWTSIVTHFYPAKVTARFAAPDGNRAWTELAEPALEPRETPDVHGYCLPHMTAAIVGHWARVRSRRCSGELDEAWMYSMSGRWKIIHLVSGTPLTTSETRRERRRATSRMGRADVSFAPCLESSP